MIRRRFSKPLMIPNDTGGPSSQALYLQIQPTVDQKHNQARMVGMC
jgi:hypothetical protein